MNRVFTAQQKIDAMTRFYEGHKAHQAGLFKESGNELNRLAMEFAEDALQVLHHMKQDDVGFPPIVSNRYDRESEAA